METAYKNIKNGAYRKTAPFFMSFIHFSTCF